MNTLLIEAIAKFKIVVSTFQKEEAIVISNQFHNDVITLGLRFPNPKVHACTRQVNVQQGVVETFMNLANEKEGTFSKVHKENVDFSASLTKLQKQAL